MNAQGEISTVLPNAHTSTMIQIGQDIYSVGVRKLYKSTDDGNTWNEVTPVNDRVVYRYKMIGDKVVAYHRTRGEIFEATFSSNGIALRELENDGIEHEYFTSLATLKGKVYITTFTGMYWRDLDGFFDDKKKE